MKKKTVEIINAAKEIVLQQFRNAVRANFYKAPYRVNERLKHLQVDENKWSQMTHGQKVSRIEKFNNESVEAAKDFSNNSTPKTPNTVTKKGLSITAKDSNITSIPFVVLELMFQEASDLLQIEGMVIPKPGSTNSSYIVGGKANNIYSVTPGKGNSLKCKRSCINFSSNVCKHILAVAEAKEILKDFINYYIKSKAGGSFSALALVSGKKSVGKKLNAKKRSNAKAKPPITTCIDILAENQMGSHDFIIQQSPSTTNTPYNFPINIPQSTLSHQTMPRMPSTLQPNNLFNANVPLSPSNFPLNNFQSFNPFMTPFTGFSVPNNISNLLSPHAPSSVLNRNVNLPNNRKILGAFSLKIVAGTNVSKCYGCRGDIVNPPQSSLQQFCVVHRDYRFYMHPHTGQNTVTQTPTNIHFHVIQACIQLKYPKFQSSDLIVVPEFLPLLNVEHKEVLHKEFGIVLP